MKMPSKRLSVLSLLLVVASGVYVYALFQRPARAQEKAEQAQRDVKATPEEFKAPAAAKALPSTPSGASVYKFSLKKAKAAEVEDMFRGLSLTMSTSLDKDENSVSAVVMTEKLERVRSLVTAMEEAATEDDTPGAMPRLPDEIVEATRVSIEPKKVVDVLLATGLVRRALPDNANNAVVYSIRKDDTLKAHVLIRALDTPAARFPQTLPTWPTSSRESKFLVKSDSGIVGEVTAGLPDSTAVDEKPDGATPFYKGSEIVGLKVANAADFANLLTRIGLVSNAEVSQANDAITFSATAENRATILALKKMMDESPKGKPTPSPAYASGFAKTTSTAGEATRSPQAQVETVEFQYTLKNPIAAELAGRIPYTKLAQTVEARDDKLLVFKVRPQDKERLVAFLERFDDYATQIVKVFHIKKVPVATVRGVLEQSGLNRLFVVDEASNSIVATGNQAVIDKVEKIVADLEANWPADRASQYYGASQRMQVRTDFYQSNPSSGSQAQPAWKALEAKQQELAAALLKERGEGTERAKLEAQGEELKKVVEQTFDERQKEQSAEVESLRARLQKLEEGLKARAEAKDKIIHRRMQELLEPETEWTNVGDSAKTPSARRSGHPEAFVNDPHSAEKVKQFGPSDAAVKDPYAAGKGLKPGEITDTRIVGTIKPDDPDAFEVRKDDVETPKVATISKVYWFHSQERPTFIPENAIPQSSDGHLLMHVDLNGRELPELYRKLNKDFVLTAEGQPTVTAKAERGFWSSGSSECYLRIPAEELAKMKVGVPYRLTPANPDGEFRWKIAENVTITKPLENDTLR